MVCGHSRRRCVLKGEESSFGIATGGASLHVLDGLEVVARIHSKGELWMDTVINMRQVGYGGRTTC